MNRHVRRIALIDANLNSYGIPKHRVSGVTDHMNAGLVSISNSLRGLNGIEHRLFPTYLGGNNDFSHIGNCVDEVIEYRPDAVAISCTSEMFNDAAFIAYVLRSEIDPLIIAGGHHFRFDNPVIPDVMDSVTHALRLTTDKDDFGIGIPGAKLFDAVVVGNGGPVRDIARQGFDTEKLPQGVYILVDGNIRGTGRGEFPVDSSPVYGYLVTNRHLNLTVMLGKMACPNGCGYCSLDNVHAEDAMQGIEKLTRHRIDRLDIIDSNPWLYRAFSEGKIRQLRAHQVHHPISSYIDPMALVEDEGLYAMFAELDINNFFSGRETSSGVSAANLQRRYRGVARSQDMLDRELVALKRLVSTANRVDVGYILTPFDTINGIKSTMDEARSLIQLGGHVTFNILTPYPGTEIRRIYHRHISDPSDFLLNEEGRYDAMTWKLPFFSRMQDVLNELMPGGYISARNLPLLEGELLTSFHA